MQSNISAARKFRTKDQLLSELDAALARVSLLEEQLAPQRGGRPRSGSPARSSAAIKGQQVDDDGGNFRSLIEGSPQGIFIGQNGKTVFANRAYAQMFGYESPSEIVGRDHLEFVAPGDRKRMKKYRTARIKGEDVPMRYQYEGIRKDGSAIWIDGFRQLIEWKGKPAILATMTDISESLGWQTLFFRSVR